MQGLAEGDGGLRGSMGFGALIKTNTSKPKQGEDYGECPNGNKPAVRWRQKCQSRTNWRPQCNAPVRAYAVPRDGKRSVFCASAVDVPDENTCGGPAFRLAQKKVAEQHNC